MKLYLPLFLSLLFLVEDLFAQPFAITTFEPHVRSATVVSFHPKGNYIASAGFDHTVKLWGTASQRYLKTLLGHNANVQDIEFSNNGNLMASIDSNGELLIWNTASWQVLQRFKAFSEKFIGYKDSRDTKLISFSLDGKHIWSVGDEGFVLKWELKNGGIVKRISTFNSNLLKEFILDTKERFIAVNSGNSLDLIDVTSGELLKKINAEVGGKISEIESSLNGEKLAFNSGRNISIYDIAEKKPFIQDGAVPSKVKGYDGFAINSKGDQLISIGIAEGIIVSDIKGNTEVYLALGLQNQCYDLAFHPKTNHVAFAVNEVGEFGYVWVFGRHDNSYTDAHAKRIQVGENIANISPINSISINYDASMLATGANQWLSLWDLNKSTKTDLDQANLIDEETGFDYFNKIAFYPQSNYLIAGSENNMLKLWDTDKKAVKKTLDMGYFANYYTINNLALSNDGNLMAFADHDSTLRLWDATTLETLDTLYLNHQSAANGKEVTFSNNNRLLATYDYANTITIFDVYTGEKLTEKASTKVGNTHFNTIYFSNDNKALFSLEEEKSPNAATTFCSIKLWEIDSKTVLQKFDYPAGIIINGFALDSLQEHLAIVFNDKIDIWHIKKKEKLASWEAHIGEITDLAFTPDFLVSSAQDGKLKIWNRKDYKLEATLYNFGQKGYAVISPTGLFDASPQAMEEIYYVRDMKVVELGELKGTDQDPGLLSKIWKKQRLRKTH